jgi:hypothetical protein
MKRSQLFALLALFSAVVLFASGCGAPPGPEGVKVTGSVTKGGKGEEGVNVGFITSDLKKGESRGVRTDAQGKFELRIKPGSYTVTLTKLVDKKGNVPKESEVPTEDYTQLEASGYLRHAYSELYADMARSPFKGIEIPEGGKELAPFEVK